MTLDAKFEFESTPGPLREFIEKSKRLSLQRTAYKTSQDIKHSLLPISGPSQPGQPPHTHTNKLRRAVAYAVDGDEAIVGPRASIVGEVGNAMEFGGNYKGQHYDARPFVEPALEKNTDFFAATFGGGTIDAIGE